MKTKMSRVSVEFDEYLSDVSRKTGLPKSQCTRLLVNSLKENELRVIGNNRRLGFKFDLKI